MPKVKKPLKIDIRDQRIPGGRFSCSARTTSAVEFRKRETAVRTLIEAGYVDVLERITAKVAKSKVRLSIMEVTAAVQRGDIESLRLAKTSPLMLGATIDRLVQRKAATRKKGTQLQVSVTVKQLESFFGVVRDPRTLEITRDVDVASISTAECERFLHGTKATGGAWAPRTQGVKFAYAKEVWGVAIKEEAETAERENRKPRLRVNPWLSIDAAPIRPTRVIFLTAPERDALLLKNAGTRECAFMALGYHAGLRVGEAVMLRTDIDVDLESGFIHVQGRPGEFAWTTKNDRNRDVPINRDLRILLEAHITSGFAGQRFFFHQSKKDRPLGNHTSWKWWVEAYNRAGIKHGRADSDAVVYHTGRHTFASLMVQKGVSPMIVAELLGDSYDEVIRTYGHLAPHNLADAVKLLESGALSNNLSNGDDETPHKD
jgi:integrase